MVNKYLFPIDLLTQHAGLCGYPLTMTYDENFFGDLSYIIVIVDHLLWLEYDGGSWGRFGRLFHKKVSKSWGLVHFHLYLFWIVTPCMRLLWYCNILKHRYPIYVCSVFRLWEAVQWSQREIWYEVLIDVRHSSVKIGHVNLQDSAYKVVADPLVWMLVPGISMSN